MIRRLATCLALLPMLALAEAREDSFVLMHDMPPIVGELSDSVERLSENDGMTHAKEVYRHETDTHHIVTHISSASCRVTGDKPASEFYVMAIQYLPRVPSSFREATRHDYFQEVYVSDETGRIRLYENVTGMQMIELTERFSPRCFEL